VLERPLGDGASASVWLAKSASGEASKVVIKLLRPDGAGLAHERFLREVTLLERLDHPAVVRLLDHGKTGDSGVYYLAMPWVEGDSLAAILEEGPLEVEDALELFADLADGLAYAHAHGVMHRDLKPHNVLVTAEGRGVLLDFGTAFDRGGERITEDGRVPGTLGWLPPEVFEPRTRPDPALGDVYALGVMLWEALEGVKAFESPPGLSATALHAWMAAAKRDRGPLRLGDGFEDDLVAFIEEATHPDPKQRLPSMAAFAEVLGCEGPWHPVDDPDEDEADFVDEGGDDVYDDGEDVDDGEERLGYDGADDEAGDGWAFPEGYGVLAATALLVVVLAGGGAWWFGSQTASAPEVEPPVERSKVAVAAPTAAGGKDAAPRAVDFGIPDGLAVALDGVSVEPTDGRIRQTVTAGPHKVELVDAACGVGRCCATFVLDIPAGPGAFLWEGPSILPACPDVAVATGSPTAPSAAPPVEASTEPSSTGGEAAAPPPTTAARPPAPKPAPQTTPSVRPAPRSGTSRASTEALSPPTPPPTTLAYVRAGVTAKHSRNGSDFEVPLAGDKCVDRADRPQLSARIGFEIAGRSVKRGSVTVQPVVGLSDGDRRCLTALIESLDVGKSVGGAYEGSVTLSFE
jgi:serine/threonine-protein kinase